VSHGTDDETRLTGQELYELWCTPSQQELGTPVTTDRAKYWLAMNPGEKRRWDRLAAWLTGSPSQKAAAQKPPPRMLSQKP
jgi:hypothetical protein